MFTMDIETIPWFRDKAHENQIIFSRKDKRLVDPEKIQANLEKVLEDAALKPLSGQIVAVGMQFEDGRTIVTTTAKNLFTMSADVFFNLVESEADIIRITLADISAAISDGQLMVTFNGKSFDMPFIFMRSIVNNIQAPNSLDYDGLIHPYRNYPHLDLKSFMQGSMDDIMASIGISDKVMEGGDISRVWSSNPQKVIDKCINDLTRNVTLYERIKGWVNIKMNYQVPRRALKDEDKELWENTPSSIKMAHIGSQSGEGS